MNPVVEVFHQECTAAKAPRYYFPDQRSKAVSTFLTVVEVGLVSLVVSTALHLDSRKWSLLRMGGMYGFFNHPRPGSEEASNTVWERVKLLWDAKPIIAAVITFPFFFSNLAFGGAFLGGVIIGGKIYVSSETRKALNQRIF